MSIIQRQVYNFFSCKNKKKTKDNNIYKKKEIKKLPDNFKCIINSIQTELYTHLDTVNNLTSNSFYMCL